MQSGACLCQRKISYSRFKLLTEPLNSKQLMDKLLNTISVISINLAELFLKCYCFNKNINAMIPLGAGKEGFKNMTR